MFPNIFHIDITNEQCIALSIRSQENRSDRYVLSKGDIEPALDDVPNDNEWSGSKMFRMKRTRTNGLVSVSVNGTWTTYKVTRQEIEILNAQLKDVCSRVIDKNDTDKAGNIVISDNVNSVTHNQVIDTDQLLNSIRIIVREELELVLGTMKNIGLSSQIVSHEPQKLDIQLQPKDTFIPTNLTQGIEGDVGVTHTESDGDSALEALKKLKEIKK